MTSGAFDTVIAVALLTLVPLLLLATTSYVKLAFVFSILRNGLGTGEAPSGLVVTVLALVLSGFVMAPVFETMLARAAVPAAQVDWRNPLATPASTRALHETANAAVEPLKGFLSRNSNAGERSTFLALAKRARGLNAASPTVTDNDLVVLVPAFLFTELKEAFQIAFMLLLPFLVLELVVTNILLVLGMNMLSPTAVALPFKLLLFVMVDGLTVLAKALVEGYVP